MSIRICINCLESGAVSCPVGPERGNQYDRYREELAMCYPCMGALVTGDMAIFHSRYQESALVKRQTAFPDEEDKRQARPTLITEPTGTRPA